MKASDIEIENISNDIFDQLRIFDSPKDAGSTICLAYYKLIKAAFSPEEKAKAFEALDADVRLIKTFLNEDWQ